jgi:tRNA 2-thiouridine synthesizing protein A
MSTWRSLLHPNVMARWMIYADPAGDSPGFQRLDLSGLFCPAVVLRIREAIDTCSAGSVVEVISTDPLSVVDVALFAKKAGHTLLSSSSELNTFRFIIGVGPNGSAS